MFIASRATFAAAGAVWLMACAPAHATESSVDAYAGEAAVLGKPTHRTQHPQPRHSGEAAKTTTSRESTSTRATNGGGSNGSSTGGGASSGGNLSTSATGGKPGASSQGPRPGADTFAGERVSGSASHSAPTPSSYPAESAGGMSLSAVDIVFIVAGIFLLVGTALLLRRDSPTTE